MFQSHLRLAVVVTSLCAAVPPASAHDKPLFSAATETPSPGEVRPSPQLVRIILKAIDKSDVEQLDGCVADQGLKHGDYASLLRAVRIRASSARNLWFVRPAEEPYCMALYGAHDFQYFLIEEKVTNSTLHYRLLFQNAGDNFSIYARQSHGLNDIEATGCIATGCRSERMSFDGREYQPVSCSSWTFSPDRQGVMQGIPKERRCGSDDGEDDQASGLIGPSGS